MGGVVVGGSRRAVVRAHEVVLPWVHVVWSAAMSVRLQSGRFSQKVVAMLRDETRYLKGCFVRTFHRHFSLGSEMAKCVMVHIAACPLGPSVLHATRSAGPRRHVGSLSVPSSSPSSPLYCVLAGDGNIGLPPTRPLSPRPYSATGSRTSMPEVNVLIVL